jgi:hypothetical protein
MLTMDQLADLVAPIALYPDPLLSQVLVASTYPLEVVEAQQWLQENHTLTGTQLLNAARQQTWDPSVEALVAFPDVLNRLNSNIRWTKDLGNAFLAQQSDVMSAVQSLRVSAKAKGRLVSTPQQTVTAQTQDGQSEIAIQPANPEVIYVPVYDPDYIWGPPAWGYYPALYYPAFGFGFWPGINIGLCFGGWGGWGWGGWGWGWGPNWFGRSVFINHTFFHRFGFHDHDFRADGSGRSVWAHDPSHRLGVTYPTHQLVGRYQAASAASRANMAGFAGRNSFSQGVRQGALTNGNHSTMPGNGYGPPGLHGVSPQEAPRAPQFENRSGMGNSRGPGFYGAPPQGGAARSFQAPLGRSFGQPAPYFGHGFGGSRGFGSFGGHGGGFGGGHGGGHR